MASTTKIMTAFLVTSLAKSEPAVLDEIVTFSQRADDTIGSTAGVRVGEKISVRELLYGLLLPSGNDASVALAEHFGKRLAGNNSAEDSNPYDQFVAAMNQKAKGVGTCEHELREPQRTHRPQPQNQSPRLNDPVVPGDATTSVSRDRGHRATRLHGGGPRGISPQPRLAKLKPAAPHRGLQRCEDRHNQCCRILPRVAWYKRATISRLLVVVLGSSSTDARYADTRNLFRWAWNQMGITGMTDALPIHKMRIVLAYRWHLQRSCNLLPCAGDRAPVVLTDAARSSCTRRPSSSMDTTTCPGNCDNRGRSRSTNSTSAHPQAKLHTDIPRLKEGGVGAQFWSVYVPASTAYNGTALSATLEQIDMVQAMLQRYPATFELALTVDDIHRIRAVGQDRIADRRGREGTASRIR